MFSMEIALAADETGDLARERMPTRKKILVVEDEPDFRFAIRMRLEANGYEVIEAGDGAAALEMARKEQPDLILLDILLPKIEGFKVARLLKFDEKYKKIPIVILTVLAQQKDRETGAAVGVEAYLTKPHKSEELLDIIAKLI